MKTHIPRCPRINCCSRLLIETSWQNGSPNSEHVVRFGYFFRASDSKMIQRFRCLECRRTFSTSTESPSIWQKKRRINSSLRKLLCSNVSQRRSALILGVQPRTIARRFRYLAIQARMRIAQDSIKSIFNSKKIANVQFDEMITSHHTKCKPLSIALSVCSETRKILGFQISEIAPPDRLLLKSRQKYGDRADKRDEGLHKMFLAISHRIESDGIIASDYWNSYPGHVHTHFPKISHQRHLSRKATPNGFGELKQGYNDPLFSINHTAAMLRANVNRLTRKTWCTTKKISGLNDHLYLYAEFHNSTLINLRTK